MFAICSSMCYLKIGFNAHGLSLFLVIIARAFSMIFMFLVVSETLSVWLLPLFIC